jgi:hypothetical protein
MGIKLNKEERETIIRTSEAEDAWQVFTFNTALKKRLRKYAADYPEFCQKVREDRIVRSETYNVKKTRLSIQLIPPYSDERIRAASEQALTQGIRNILPEYDGKKGEDKK